MFGRFLAAVLAALFACSPAFALSPAQQSVLFAKKPAAASYVGPGDVVAMSFWVGMRAYSAATRGMAAVNICSESGGVDVTCEDELTDAVTGKLVLGTIGSTCSSVPCTVKVWYDRTGNNFCSSAACNFTQTTVANRATFLITGCPGTSGQPCAEFTGGECYATAATPNISQPFGVTNVAERNAFTTSSTGLLVPTSISSFEGYDSTINTVKQYAGNVNVTAPATDNSLHSRQDLFNGASSSITIDGGSPTTGSPGSGGLDSVLVLGSTTTACSASAFGGYLDEIGVKNSGASLSALTANQRAYWGF